MSNIEEAKKMQALIEEGMKAVHQKLRKDKIKAGEPLVISRDNQVILVDPKTMEEIKTTNNKSD